MQRLTFRQYLQTVKEQLATSIASVPTSLIEYKVKKYNNTTIGDTPVKVFAGDTIVVEWKYPEPGIQEIVSVRIKSASSQSSQLIESTGVTTIALQRWLLRVAHAGKFTNRLPKLL